jgi:spore germination protein YaaH
VIRNIILSVIGIIAGVLVGYLFIFRTPVRTILKIPINQSMGFLPYWLLDKAKPNYSQYLNGIYYFGLIIGDDGKLVEFANPQEKEPGWYALESGKVDSFLKTAKENHQKLSLVAFSGDNNSIGILVSDPIEHADNLVSEAIPIMKRYGFSDLNLDIEYLDVASKEARMNFTKFVKEVKTKMKNINLGTLSIDVSPTAFVKDYLVDPKEVSKYVDSMIIMGYDYHFQGSYVTGPVAPLFGAGNISEFDIKTAIEKALVLLPKQKIILGVPLYGYEWETITDNPRSPVIPGTGLTASSLRVQQLLSSCSTCSAQFDSIAQEKYVVYKDLKTDSYHQIFYPDKEIMSAKIKFAEKYNLGGIALWALGYEDLAILEPFNNY